MPSLITSACVKNTCYFFLTFSCLLLPVNSSVVSPSARLSAEMSPSFVTRLCSDWTVHPFSIWLTRLSRWRDPFIPTVQQSAPCCNLSPHPKHRCKDTGYFSRVHAHTVFMYTHTHTQKKNAQRTYTIGVCMHIHLWANTNCASAAFYCDVWVHMQIVFDNNLKRIQLFKNGTNGKQTYAKDSHRSHKLHQGHCCLPHAL